MSEPNGRQDASPDPDTVAAPQQRGAEDASAAVGRAAAAGDEEAVETGRPVHYGRAALGGIAGAVLVGGVYVLLMGLGADSSGVYAVAMGLVIGLAVQFFGRGRSAGLGAVAAIIAFIGCLLGTALMLLVRMVQDFGPAFLEMLGDRFADYTLDILAEAFQPLDVALHVVGIWLAFVVACKARLDRGRKPRAPKAG
jgi:hypothetical protein